LATLAIGRDVSITIFTASSLNSGEKLFFGRGKDFTFPDVEGYSQDHQLYADQALASGDVVRDA
jgi:hypothetical protein